MNLILLFDSDFITPSRVKLTGRRLLHLQDVLNAQEGQTLSAGKLNGLMGEATVVSISGEEAILDCDFYNQPPSPLHLTLIMALPRPHVLRRTLISASSLGVKKIIILNFNRVEKSLWNSSALREDAVREQLVLGLEQAKDTLLPEVVLESRFKPFVEDKLPGLIQGTIPLVAHPGGGEMCPVHVQKPVTLIIGPEGGIIDFEMAHLKDIGFKSIDLGPRILRIETVLPFLIGSLYGGRL